MKKLKKALAGLTVGAMLMGVAPAALYTALPADVGIVSTAYAAKGGAKISIPKPAPKAPATSAPKSNAAESKSVSGNGKDYAPSKDAKSLDKNAPASNSATAKNGTSAAAGTAAQSSSPLGSMMRNIGLLAGGMFLGSMLAGLFGLGGGFLADVLGLLMNIVLFAFVFMAIKWAIGRLMGRGKSSGQSYGGYTQTRRDEPINVTPKKKYPDIKQVSLKPDEDGYDAKSTADKYRNR